MTPFNCNAALREGFEPLGVVAGGNTPPTATGPGQMRPGDNRASGIALPGESRGLVLVADDDADVRTIKVHYLNHLGFEALVACDGVEALDRYRRHAADIVLVMLDLTMPKMDGATAFHEIRKLSPRARVILVSGYSVEKIAELFPEEKPDGFIQKPFGIEELREKMERVLV